MDWDKFIPIVGAVAGLIGAIIGIYDMRHNRFLALYQFMSETGDPILIKARHHVYSSEGHIDIDDEQTAQVVNFYHRWGLLFKRHYLPRWIFDAGFGHGSMRLYVLSKPYIDLFREIHQDNSYAKNYEWLYKYLQKRYRRKEKLNHFLYQLKNYLAPTTGATPIE